MFDKKLFAQLSDGTGYQKTKETEVLNPYTNNYNHTNSQALHDSLVSESIQWAGVECFYLKRDIVDLDIFFGEAPNSKFTSAKRISVYIKSFDGYEGQQDFFSKFAYEVNDELTFQINPTLFKTQTGMDEPVQGDLIYFKMGKDLFEISWVEQDTPFFQLGRNAFRELTATKFVYSGEKMDVKGVDVESATNFDISELEMDEIEPVNNVDGLTDTTYGNESEEIENETQTYVEPFNPINGKGSPFDEDL